MVAQRATVKNYDKALRRYNALRDAVRVESHGAAANDNPFVTIAGFTCQPDPYNDDAAVGVEAGVEFWPTHARTYYIRDGQNEVESVYYGEDLPYLFNEMAFVNHAKVQLAGAAEAAFNNDVRSCKFCGEHYLLLYGCECEEARFEGEDEDED